MWMQRWARRANCLTGRQLDANRRNSAGRELETRSKLKGNLWSGQSAKTNAKHKQGDTTQGSGTRDSKQAPRKPPEWPIHRNKKTRAIYLERWLARGKHKCSKRTQKQQAVYLERQLGNGNTQQARNGADSTFMARSGNDTDIDSHRHKRGARNQSDSTS